MKLKEFTLNDFREIAENWQKSDLSKISDEALLKFVLNDDLGMDSLDITELTMEIEKNYGILITENEFNAISGGNLTVQEVIDKINQFLKSVKFVW